MRRDFDRGSRSEQLAQVHGLKKPGRKHRKQPGNKAVQRKRNREARGEAVQVANAKQNSRRIKAYFAGEGDEYPRLRKLTKSAI